MDARYMAKKLLNSVSDVTALAKLLDLETDMYVPIEMFDESEIRSALVNKIQQLTEDDDG
jgi:hypothetical protein